MFMSRDWCHTLLPCVSKQWPFLSDTAVWSESLCLHGCSIPSYDSLYLLFNLCLDEYLNKLNLFKKDIGLN